MAHGQMGKKVTRSEILKTPRLFSVGAFFNESQGFDPQQGVCREDSRLLATSIAQVFTRSSDLNLNDYISTLRRARLSISLPSFVNDEYSPPSNTADAFRP